MLFFKKDVNTITLAKSAFYTATNQGFELSNFQGAFTCLLSNLNTVWQKYDRIRPFPRREDGLLLQRLTNKLLFKQLIDIFSDATKIHVNLRS